MSEFKNKVVFVTGGAYGLGREVVRAFARQGAKVSFVDINEDRANDTVTQVRDEGGEAMFIRADVRQESEIGRAHV